MCTWRAPGLRGGSPRGVTGAGTSPRHIHVGTSGWSYSWNPDGLRWYIEHSGLDTVELNMSFYRLPPPWMVKSWARLSEKSGLRWAIKIHGLITHRYVLSEKSYRFWQVFIKRFEPLDKYTDFYLLQLPPRFKPTSHYIERLESFVKHVNLGWRLAVEWRDPAWYTGQYIEWARRLGFTVVSIDSPIGVFYVRSGPYVYVRFHGRMIWYAYRYSAEELREAAEKILGLGGEAVYAYFNNNHDMLDNARMFKSLLEEALKYEERGGGAA